MFHKNEHFGQGLMVIGQKMTELLVIEISKMGLGHPVVIKNPLHIFALFCL